MEILGLLETKGQLANKNQICFQVLTRDQVGPEQKSRWKYLTSKANFDWEQSIDSRRLLQDNIRVTA